MRLGIEAAFSAANARGGVNGRQLKLIAADDGYEPARTADTMKRLYEKDQVFAVVGNVGTPTAAVALPYALDRKMIFFGAFTGAGLLRSDPPDRYVFNYRASYAEETAATVQYLVKVKRLKPSQIAVFAQQDAYGDAGFSGVAKAIRALGGDENAILRLHYQRNTVDVDDAVDQLRKSRVPIRAVVMVPGYRAAAKFIEKTRDLFPGMIYTSVSFVGSTALANELMLLGKRYASGVIVTQVVPALDGHSSLVLDYKAALAKYFPGEQPDYVSLEGYVAANVLITALRRNGPDLDTEKLVTTLENLRDLDIGLGTPVSFGRSEHQGVHKVWGTQIDENGRYQTHRPAVSGTSPSKSTPRPERKRSGLLLLQELKFYGVEINPLLVATIQRLPQRTIESTLPTPGTVSPCLTRQTPFGPCTTAMPSTTSISAQPAIVVGSRLGVWLRWSSFRRNRRHLLIGILPCCLRRLSRRWIAACLDGVAARGSSLLPSAA